MVPPLRLSPRRYVHILVATSILRSYSLPMPLSVLAKEEEGEEKSEKTKYIEVVTLF